MDRSQEAGNVDESASLGKRFEENRRRLQGVAYRMLGSLPEAEDAVQEAWIRLSRTDAMGIDNLGGWLTTVVARVCLDMLRARKSRAEEPAAIDLPAYGERREAATAPAASLGPPVPEQEAALADSVGIALLVVLETLTPAERLAFVLHEMFDLSFDEIAPIVGRSTTAARQLASRARRRVRGADRVRSVELTRQREVVGAYLAAVRGGDFNALLSVLDPDVHLRADRCVVPPGAPTEARGAANVAKRATGGAARARFAQAALVNGAVGIVFAPRGRLRLVLAFAFSGDKIMAIDVIGDPERLRRLDLATLLD
jgi:RNA polymerase sigma-70 factor (ECF subfamily)